MTQDTSIKTGLVTFAQHVLEQAQVTAVDRTRKGAALCRALRAGVMFSEVDADLCQALHRSVELKKQQYNPNLPFFQPPDPRLCNGDFSVLQTLVHKLKIGFLISALTMGLNFFCETGKGKSTLLFLTVAHCAALGLPCVLYCKKKDRLFWNLLRLYPKRTLILKPEDNYYNFFYSQTGNPMDLLSRPLQYFQSVYDRFDSIVLLIRLLEIFMSQAK